MIKILLYASVLFVSSLSVGESIVSVDDNQLTEPFGFCDQCDSSDSRDAGDPDEPDEPATAHQSFKLETAQTLVADQLTLSFPPACSTPYSIRAPPV